MKAPNGPLILILFCALVAAVCWFAITAITTPTRAIASGVALSVGTGLFIWFANTDRLTVARGLIALGAVAMAAPLSAVQALSNDFLFSAFDAEQDSGRRLIDYDQAMQTVWGMVLGGAAVGIVLIIIGGFLHRTPKG